MTVGMCISIIENVKLYNQNKRLTVEKNKLSNDCYSLLYENFALTDRIEKIKNLNIIDYSNNDYYKELLMVK